MIYGGSTYGSTAIGGSPASQSTFFSSSESLTIGVYRRTVEYLGDASFFAVETRMNSESDDPLRLMRIYSHNDENETPQLQTSTGVESFYTQSIIGAARFIVVELELLANLNPIVITITGREYFQ